VSVQRRGSPSWRLRNRVSGFPQPSGGLLAKKAALERPGNELGAACESQLAHDSSPLGLNGAYRKVQLARDVSIGVAVGEQNGSDPLALGQQLLIKHGDSVTSYRPERIRDPPDGPAQFLRVMGATT
jgi:hypothetical protein